MPATVEEIGLSFVILTLVFAGAASIRRFSRPLRALFIPTAVIGGFLMLALGPEGLGRVTGGYGLFSDTTFAVWKVLPGLLINVMCASLLLGERLPPLKTIWGLSGSHVIMAGIMSTGQFAVGSIVALLVLGPVFGFTDKSGALIELSFAGGHGTLAGLSAGLVAYGAEDLLEVGLGLATIGMVTGIVIGTMLVNYAVNSPNITVARHDRTSDKEDLDIDHHQPKPDDVPMDEWNGMTQVTAATVMIGVSIVAGIVLHDIFRRVFLMMGSDFFDRWRRPRAAVGRALQVRVGGQPARRRGTGRSLGRWHRDLCDWHVVTRCAEREPGSAGDPRGRLCRVERLRGDGDRTARVSEELVRAFAGGVR